MTENEKIDALIEKINEKVNERDLLIDDLQRTLIDSVKNEERVIFKSIVNDFIDKLDKDENGRVKNTAKNKKLLRGIDKLFKNFNLVQAEKIIKVLLSNITKLITFNQGYYSLLQVTGTPVVPITQKVKDSVRAWIGIDNKGRVIKGAYLDAIIKNPSTLASVKNFAYQAVTTSRDFQTLKKDFEKLIQGNQKELGVLSKYYRNFIYDSISQVDRAAANEYAQGLKLKHAIYAGGLIETSRKFCKIHNGKVYAISEIANFNITVARPDNYNPFVHLGGFGCRHHYNYVSYAVAKRLRPDVPIE